MAFCSAAFGAYYQTNYRLWMTKTYINVSRAYAVLPDKQTMVSRSIDDDTLEIFDIEAVNQTKLMVEEFIKVIKKKKSINFEKELLLQAKVMEAARKSNKEKRRVKIKEIK